MNAPKFDTFVFDLDGTLLDTLPDLVVLTNHVLVECGWPKRTRDEILSYVGNGASALMYQAVPEGTPADKAEEAIALWKAFYPKYANDLTRPYPHIVEVLQTLRAQGCKIGVASNKYEPGVEMILNKCLPGLIDIAHGEGNLIPRKPNPAMLNLVISELDSTPQKAVYFGDSPTDIECARAAGVFAVGVSWGYHKASDFAKSGWEPDLLINDAREILSLD
jgi:phosphoglycolate phosphatase